MKSVLNILGASNHSLEDREDNDYYATDPKAVELLLEVEKFNQNIWEPACGEGHISKVLEKNGYTVKSTDLIDRGFGVGGIDFFKIDKNEKFDGDIITNPPYADAKEFVEKALSLIEKGNKLALFLKLQFLEGKKRKEMFLKNPPKTVYVSSSRLNCWKGGKIPDKSSALCYCWFVWEKGFQGDPIIKWIN